MAISLFSRQSNGEGQSGVKRDPRKAQRFFEHAETVADARNHDYAIECYINGLRHDPDNMNAHEALRDVALRRKVAGGKPAGMSERFKSGGGTPLDRMLHKEMLWSREPLNISHGLETMRLAVELDQQDDELNMAEAAYWAGGLVLELNNQQKQNLKVYLTARDLFARIGAYDKAVEACKHALRQNQNDDHLLGELKDLEAERTMQEGGYSSGEAVEEGGFRRFVRDAEQQQDLEQQDHRHKTADAANDLIQRRREEYEEDPRDVDRLQKLVDALVHADRRETEDEAIQLLQQAWEQTGQYRYKVRIGDISMRRMNRKLRQLNQQLKQNPGDEQAKQDADKLKKEKLQFELEEYTERTKNYPTDMGLRFELGKRLYQARQFDEAIGAFQQAKSDPKHRAAGQEFLGSCYIQKGWLEEAADTLRQGIEAHPVDNDRLALELRYLLMDALERSARQNTNPAQAKEAQKVASQILQTDINFRDIRSRMDTIRSLGDELQQNKADA